MEWLAGLPIPALIAAMVTLWAADLRTVYESQLLLAVCNFLFSTLASLLVVIMVGQSFLVRSTPGLLLIGCGVLIWGAAGTVVFTLMSSGANVMITVHNSLVWLSALCHLTGAIFSMKPRRTLQPVIPILLIAYSVALCAAWMVTRLALDGWMPVFFVQGQGGTPIRDLVLGSAALMFAFTTGLIWLTNRGSFSAFVWWYGLALLLVATGLFGIMIESVHSSLLSWIGRLAQFMGGAYMLIAAIATVRQKGFQGISLSEALRESEERYRMLFETMTEGFALHEIITDNEGRPCDYRFLNINPAFERLTGLKRIDVIGKRVRQVLPGTESHWIQKYGKVALTGEPLHMENYHAGLRRWYAVFAYRPEPDRFAVVFSDITERKKAEEALRESERRYSALFANKINAMAHCRVITDDQGQPTDYVILKINEAYERIIGIKKADIEGHRATEVFPDIKKYALDYIGMYGKIALQGGEIKFEELFEATGQILSIYAYSPMPGEFAAIFTDVTERKQAEEAIKRLNNELLTKNEELAFSNKELESFIYSVSHDLRAPLRHISGFSDLLKKDLVNKLDKKGKRYLSTILKGTEKMSRLIDDLLNLSRISRQEIKRTEVNMSEVAVSIVANLREAHPGRSVDVNIRGGLTSFADGGLIEVALSNLLGNSWKFTAKTEHASIEFGSIAQDGQIFYYVRDNGVGFDQQYADKMFLPFHRLHSEAAFEGTGIGLAIVDRIIRCHGGQIWAEGIEGEGATIYFSLTLKHR